MSKWFTKRELGAWGGFVVAQSRIFQEIEEDLRARFGITHAEFEVLLRLYRHPDGRMRLQDLAAASLLTPSGTSRLVDRLEKAGHVRREVAEEDRRGSYAALTPQGRAHFDEVGPAHVALVRDVFLNRFTDDELDQLATFWARLDAPGGSAPPRGPG